MNRKKMNARSIALKVLQEVQENDAYANLVLPKLIATAGLDSRDAAFATELTSGTLRMQGRYDRIIELASKRKTRDIEPVALNILRLGTHQLLSTRVARHAAVNESVILAKRENLMRATGFINAVLRRVGERSNEEWDAKITEAAKSLSEAKAAIFAHPEWIVEAFTEALKSEGRENEIQDLLQADNTAPKVALAHLGGPDPQSEIIIKRGLSPIGYELESGDPATALGALRARTGEVRVQDPGSQLAALLLARALPKKKGESWLDLCAGPGGKTALLAAEASASAITVRANEVAPHRAELVRKATTAFKEVVNIVSHDGRDNNAYDGAEYDRILVDAPCSGLGALRRRPEARWRKKPEDVEQLVELQSELLMAASKHTKRGGLVAYVTCSPHIAETRGIVDQFLSGNSEFVELNAKSLLKEIVGAEIDLGDSADLSVQLWPHRHSTDAMFVSLLQRQ